MPVGIALVVAYATEHVQYSSSTVNDPPSAGPLTLVLLSTLTG
jgi:hypothetical protein